MALLSGESQQRSIQELHSTANNRFPLFQLANGSLANAQRYGRHRKTPAHSNPVNLLTGCLCEG